VVAFEATKTLSKGGAPSPAGTFSITLRPVTDLNTVDSRPFTLAQLYRALPPQTVISIGFDQDGGIMSGLIDAVSESETAYGPTRGRALTITGRDFGKVLETDNIVKASVAVPDFERWDADIEAELGEKTPFVSETVDLLPANREHDASFTFLDMSITDVIRYVVDAVPGMRIPILGTVFGRDPLNVEGTIGKVLDTSRSVTSWDDERVFQQGPWSYQGNVFNYIAGLLDADFYEIWVDSLPVVGPLSRPQLVVRPKPFDEEPYFIPVTEDPGIGWERMQNLAEVGGAHEVTRQAFRSGRFERSDAEAIAFYLCLSRHQLASDELAMKDGLFYPLVDTWTLRRYGLRLMQSNLTLIQGDRKFQTVREDPEYSNKVAAVLLEKRNRLFNWNRLNPFYEQATITVDGKDLYRIGDKVRLPWRADPTSGVLGMEYYCKAVSWSWQYGAPTGYMTRLGLTRGHNSGTIAAVRALVAAESSTRVPEGFTKIDL